MYVVRCNFKSGEYYIDTGEEIIAYDEAVIEFLEDAVDLIKNSWSDKDVVSCELYECKQIELPAGAQKPVLLAGENQAL